MKGIHCGFLPLLVLTFLAVINPADLMAQHPVRQFSKGNYNEAALSANVKNKKIPQGIRAQVLIALSFYPELKDRKIVFRLRKRNTPLTSRPRIFGVFRSRKKRPYVITISTKAGTPFDPIMFHNLPYNAQIGVLGHELGHISHYNSQSSWKLLGLPFNLLSKKFTDHFEFNTDLICIEHGLGHQLYAWSSYVREALNISEWKGTSGSDTVDQRYMNPETIRKFMSENSIYETMD